MPRAPAEFAHRPLAGGDQHRGIPGAAVDVARRDRVPGDAPAAVDHLAHAEPGAVAQVDDPVASRFGVLQRQRVRVGEVAHVDVVADAGAVRGGPVVAVHQDLLAPAGRHLQHQRDQMGLDGVPLTEPGVGAGDVEVPQARRPQTVRGGVGGDGVVDGQFGGAVGVGGAGGRILGDRNRFRLAVSRRGGGEHQPRCCGRTDHLEQLERLDDVAEPVPLRRLDRLPDQGARREMQHPVEGAVAQQSRGRRHHVVVDEIRAVGHCVGVSGGQIVDDHHPVSLLEKHFRAHTADIAGAAGDEQLHAKALACSTMLTSTRTPMASARSSMSKFG